MEPLSIMTLLGSCLAAAKAGCSALDAMYDFIKDVQTMGISIKALKNEIESGKTILELIEPQVTRGSAVLVPKVHEYLRQALEGYEDSLKRVTEVAEKYAAQSKTNKLRKWARDAQFVWNQEETDKFRGQLKTRAEYLYMIYNLGLQPGATAQGQQKAAENPPPYSALASSAAATNATSRYDADYTTSSEGERQLDKPRRPTFFRKDSSRGLIEAAAKGDQKEMQRCIDKRADVNHQSKDTPIKHGGMAPIHAAAEKGQLAAVELLIGKGADIHLVIAATKKTALHLAARHGSSTVVEALLKRGARVNARDVNGRTPLLDSTREDIKMILLKAKADVSVRDEKGTTPLHDAAAHGHVEALKFILTKGAEVDARDSLERTPLWLACSSQNGVEEKKQEHMVRMLLDAKASPNAMNKEDRSTPFSVALKGGRLSLVGVLLAEGVEPDVILPFLKQWHDEHGVRGPVGS